MIGPLRESESAYLKTVTFFVTPDQLAALVIAAQTHSKWNAPPPTIAPVGAGCSLLLSVFEDLSAKQAVIGGTDITMRQYLPLHILAFSMTVPMFAHLTSLGDDSFLTKPVLENLLTSRRRKQALSPFDTA